MNSQPTQSHLEPGRKIWAHGSNGRYLIITGAKGSLTARTTKIGMQKGETEAGGTRKHHRELVNSAVGPPVPVSGSNLSACISFREVSYSSSNLVPSFNCFFIGFPFCPPTSSFTEAVVYQMFST